MKIFAAWALCLFSVGIAKAGELSMTAPILSKISEETTRHIDSKSHKSFEQKWKLHHFLIYLTNQSDHSLKVVTSQFETQGSTSQPDCSVTITTAAALYLGKSQVIPAVEELRIVGIRPGESAAVEFVVKSNRSLNSLTATYAPEDHFAGRFGFWTGSVTGPAWRRSGPADSN